MASSFLSSILSKTIQVAGSVRRLVVSPSSSSDPRSSFLKDLKKLERTLQRIQAVIHDAEEREILEEAVKLWVKELKEVAYDAEDVLDEYHYEELRAQADCRASLKRKRVEGDDEEEVSASLSTMVVSIPDGMGDRIREIRERFDEISEDRKRLRLREEDGERRVLKASNYPPPTSHMVDESSIYGREHDKKEVIDLLLSEGIGSVISVVPIVGKGGLGKTTIARLVYNDSEVKGYFDLTGWVCVSDDFDVTRLTRAIIESLTQSPYHLAQLSALQNTLKEKVQGKKVLLVLDDVWNEQQSHWESLKIPFVGAETVRIIMTCRNDSVAQIMQTVPPCYPHCLSPEKSWSLFKHYAFGFGGEDREEQPCLADIGKQIVKKCSGLPLAVKTVGSLLRHEIDEDSWMEVLQSDLWELDRNDEILGSLRLSYSRMPADLKPCFVYCSMFPKDFKFDKDDLLRLWMAQGYIPSGGRRRMEVIGDEYFDDLQRRSFFDCFDDRFKMHDMIHDLAKSIAGNECYAIVDKKQPDSLEKVRHLYVEEDAKELVESINWCNFRALRTLLPRSQYNNAHPMPKFPRIQYNNARPMPTLENTQFLLQKYLRVLEFSWEMKDEIPDLLGNLKHLRYLHIHSQIIKKLPESVCLLYHLQTLILCCENLKRLPGGIGNLKHLRYLHISSKRIKKLPKSVCLLHHLLTLIVKGPSSFVRPNGIDIPVGIIRKLTNLQSLHIRHPVHDSIGALKQLVNLGTLFISGLRNVVNVEDAKDVDLKHKHQLQQLFLCWNALTYQDLENTSVTYNENRGLLHLEVFQEENKDIPTDEKREEAVLEYLQPHANLKMMDINGYGGSKFPKWMGNLHSLGTLKIYNCPGLQLLSEGLPSKLRNLYINECQQLTSLPEMQNLTSLEQLTIKNCPRLQLLSEKGLPSELQYLHIEECLQLTSLPEMQNLTSLEQLTIKNCPQLQLLSEEGPPSKFQYLHIKECHQLTSLPEMQNLTSLEKLTIKNYRKLQIMAKDQPSFMPSAFVDIVDCPGLGNWCQIQKINCFQVVSSNKLTISNTWEKIKQEFNDLPSTEHGCRDSSTSRVELLQPSSHLYMSNRWTFLGEQFVLEELTIWSCTHIPALAWLSWSTSLHSLVIKDCPDDELLPDDLLPSTLKSLVVDSCQNLRTIQLAQANRDALEELQIVNCPSLVTVEGLNRLFIPKFLKIQDCPRLRICSH